MRSSYIIISILLLVFSCVSSSAEVTCDICKKNISGRYITGPDNTPYCLECYSRYSACSSCGKVSKSLMDLGEYKFCRECYVKLKKCDICGAQLTGGYVTYPDLGINVCDKCEKTSARCQACDRPSKKLNRVGEMKLCDACASKAERCYCCGNALLDSYRYFESDRSRKYCERCISEYEGCADCGAPSGPRGSRLDDGRYLCPDCRMEAIFDPSLITSIKLGVIEYLSKGMNMSVEHNIAYSIQDKPFLEKKSEGLSKDINGLFYRSGHDFDIYVLYGLRKKDLIWVLAHEITHAWQAENCTEKLPIEDREGFAQWVAFHAALNSGYRQYAENMLSGESIYSSGLNKMVELERRQGINAVFDYIKNK